MINHNPHPGQERRDEILLAALRQQALARRGRRVIATGASAALLLLMAGLLTWRDVSRGTPILPSGPTATGTGAGSVRELMAAQTRIPTPDESHRQDPRFRLIGDGEPRLVVERVSTTPGLTERYAVSTSAASITLASDDDLARALHSIDPGSGLVRVDGKLFAASGNALVRPENLTAPASEAPAPQSLLHAGRDQVGV
jgi:hypothetical protein